MVGITRLLHGYPIPAPATVLLAFCFVVIFGCSAQKLAVKEERPKEERTADVKPSWTLSGKHPAYAHPSYILGVGLAKGSGNPAADRQLADQNAFSEIARQIFAHVSSDVSVERLEVVGNKVETIPGRTIADSRV